MKEIFVFAALVAVATCTRLTLTIGDPASLSFGNEKTTYCVLRDNFNNVVFEYFGSCQYRIDHVTAEHAGKWEATIASDTEDFAKPVEYIIETVPRPIVNTSFKINEDYVDIQCSLNTSVNFIRAKIRSPNNEIFILGESDDINKVAKRTTSEKDGYDSVSFTLTYYSKAEAHGIWRCGIDLEGPSENSQFYGFINIPLIYEHTSIYQQPKLTSQTMHVNANSGNSFMLMCNYNNSLDYCYFRSQHKGRIYAVATGVSNNEYEYVGAGLESGECGIRILNSRPEQSGSWSCNINAKDTPNTLTEYMSVLVAGVQVDFTFGPDRKFTITASNFGSTRNLDSCRFVRSDGLSISSEQFPSVAGYFVNVFDNVCTLVTENFCNLDTNNWLVAIRVRGDRMEHFTVATPEIEPEPVPPPQQPRPPSSGGSSFFWVWRTFFGFLILGFMLVLISLMITDYRRKWASRKSIAVRSGLNTNISHISNTTPAQTQVVVDPRLVEEKPALA